MRRQPKPVLHPRCYFDMTAQLVIHLFVGVERVCECGHMTVDEPKRVHKMMLRGRRRLHVKKEIPQDWFDDS